MRNILRKTYFWVYGKTNLGKPVVMGPYGQQLRADMIADKLEDSSVFPLLTRNMQQATRSIKAKLVHNSDNVDKHIVPHQHSMQGENNNQSIPFEGNNFLAQEILESPD